MYSYMINLHSFDSTDTIELMHDIKYDRYEFIELIKNSVDPMIDKWFSEETPSYGWKYGEIYLLDSNGEIISTSMYYLVRRLIKYICDNHNFIVREPDIAVSISFDETLSADDFIAMGSSESLPDSLNKFIIEKVVEKLRTIQKEIPIMALDQYIEMLGEPTNEYELSDIINKYENYRESIDVNDKNS